MKQQILSILKFTVLLAIGVILLLFAFKGQDINKLFDALAHANYWWVLASILVSILAHYLRALRWNMLIKPLGYEPSAQNTFYAVMSGYLANLAIPRMGEVTRCGALNKTDKVPVHSLIGTVIVERVIDIVSLFIVLLVAIAFQFEVISSFLYNNLLKGIIEKLAGNTAAFVIIFGVLLVLIIMIYFIWETNRSALKKSPVGAKFFNLLKGIKNGLVSVAKIDHAGLFIFYSVAIWVCYYLSTYFCFFAIPATSHLSAATGVFILAAGGLGMSAPVQGGIGAYHWVVSQGLVLFGIAQTDGLAYATINHSAQTVLILIVGAISLVLVLANRKKGSPESPALSLQA